MVLHALYGAILFACSCALVTAGEKSLYEAGDHVVEFDVDTFDRGVYGQSRAFFIEFYSSWCGACISYAPKFKSFAAQVQTWTSVVQVAVLNCADERNSPVCREHSIDSFPTLKYFKFNSLNKDDGKRFDGDKHSLPTLPLELAQLVRDDWLTQRPGEWPSFDLLPATATLNDVWSAASRDVQYTAVIVEASPSRVGWANVVNFATEPRLRLALAEPTHALTGRVTHTPPRLLVFARGRVEPVFVSSDPVTWLDVQKRLNETLTSSVVHHEDKSVDTMSDVRQFEVQLVDLISAMHYMLMQEIPRKAVIDAENLLALKAWIHMLSKFAPGTVPMRRLFYRLDEYLNTITGSVSADEWTRKVDAIQADLGHPLPTNTTWIACRGSKPYLRGYTCGLWTLMHATTVQAYKLSKNDAEFKAVDDVLEPIHQFIFRFLSCEECAKHFDQMSLNNNMKAATKPEEAILWLWRAHNNVNRRLVDSPSSDPQFPKQQFPPRFLCPDCRLANAQGDEFDEHAVLAFLNKYYTDVKTDTVKGAITYVVSSFDAGKKIGSQEKRVNPKFAAVAAERVNDLEESERRLRREQMNANPQRRWKDLDDASEREVTESSRSFTLLWVALIAFVAFIVYSKYRRNRTKFWKTFYYYNDYKL